MNTGVMPNTETAHQL